jgi:hypothetical protein
VLVRPSMVTAAVSPTGELPQFLVADGLRVALSDVGCASTSLPLRDLKKRPNYSRYFDNLFKCRNRRGRKSNALAFLAGDHARL